MHAYRNAQVDEEAPAKVKQSKQWVSVQLDDLDALH